MRRLDDDDPGVVVPPATAPMTSNAGPPWRFASLATDVRVWWRPG